MHVHPLIHSELARQRQLDLQRDGQRPHRFSRQTRANAEATLWKLVAARVRGHRLSTAVPEDVVQPG